MKRKLSCFRALELNADPNLLVIYENPEWKLLPRNVDELYSAIIPFS